MPQRPYLAAAGLSYEVPPDRTLFKNVQFSLCAGDRVALVGPNGVGKTTLLRILSGQVKPTAGLVQRYESVYYLPQVSTVRQSLKQETVLHFLSSISDEWWTVAPILEGKFNTVLDLSLPISDLSGGELTRLLLAVGLAQEPEVLLLDEPTNHMDYRALEQLRQCLQQFEGAFLMVSHKPFFLDQVVDQTWELTAEGLQVYGGNFSFYRQQKQNNLAAQLRSYEVAQKALKRAKTMAVQEQQRAAQSRQYGRKQAEGMPKILAGAYKRQAEVTAGKLKQKHEAAIAEATQQVTETKVKTNKATSIQLEEKSQHHQVLIWIQGANLWIADRQLLQNIQFELQSGDRVVIAGANGSGKSSLIQAILNQTADAPTRLESGEVFCASNLDVVYLDQTYELVDRHLTVLENMQVANPELKYQWIRQQLGHFLFFNQAVDRLAAWLSGGELARLALAMISVSQTNLLILDEPTNNLDIPTVDQMVHAINEYQGALLVISHDLDFLNRINLTQAFKIKDQRLERTAFLPNQPEQYYQELLS